MTAETKKTLSRRQFLRGAGYVVAEKAVRTVAASAARKTAGAVAVGILTSCHPGAPEEGQVILTPDVPPTNTPGPTNTPAAELTPPNNTPEKPPSTPIVVEQTPVVEEVPTPIFNEGYATGGAYTPEQLEAAQELEGYASYEKAMELKDYLIEEEMVWGSVNLGLNPVLKIDDEGKVVSAYYEWVVLEGIVSQEEGLEAPEAYREGTKILPSHIVPGKPLFVTPQGAENLLGVKVDKVGWNAETGLPTAWNDSEEIVGYAHRETGQWTVYTPEPTPTPQPPEVNMDRMPTMIGTTKHWEEDHVVYRAEEGNRWGIEEGGRIGFFREEATVRRIKRDQNGEPVYVDEEKTTLVHEEGRRVGSIWLHPDVLDDLYYQSGYPNNLVMALPIDITSASEDGSLEGIDGAIEVRETLGADGLQYLVLSVLEGSQVLNSFPTKSGQLKVTANDPYMGMVAYHFGPGGEIYAEGNSIGVLVPVGDSTGVNTGTYEYGSTIMGDYTVPSSFSSSYIHFLNSGMEPDLPQGVNMVITTVKKRIVPVENGSVSLDNILQLSGSLVGGIARDSSFFKE